MRVPPMKHIGRAALSTSLEDRISYLTDFIEFGDVDIQALNDIAPLTTSLIPTMLDVVYTKPFTYDVTKVAFLHRSSACDGKLAVSLEALGHNNDRIKLRKDFLKVWVVKLLTGDYKSGKNWEYLNKMYLEELCRPR